ncbi:ATP-binding protein [uncultured Pseudokineococcus sp.]|uniref:ATP-binding protein n=1 Tax=uncultured Pseudokineococcus sp. TaxID=1642928 RepID=UPI002633AFCB|nr:ATP-binding protein [uncultured Pseudokineococcus sp.]
MTDDARPVAAGARPVSADLGRMTLGPRAGAARSARRFVEDQLVGAGLEHLADDAGLLTTELAANAVLHARTDFDVVVHRVASGARVEVRDRSSVLPVFTAPSATAMSGRGLLLVQTLAAAWGSEVLPVGGKSVWFELAETAVVADLDLSVDDLLAAWADEEPAPQVPVPRLPPSEAASGRHVVVADVPAQELLAAKEHLDDLLRELQLVLLDTGDGGEDHSPSTQRTAEVVALARRLDAAARAFDVVRRQVREQVSRAVAAGLAQVTLRLEASPGDGAAAVAYRSAVEAAEVLALEGALLTTTDDLGRHGAVRRDYLDDFIAQVGHR